MDHGTDDADFLLISHREAADIFLLSKDFSTHQLFERLQAFIHFLLAEAIDFTYEIEVFFRGKVIDQETLINKGTHFTLPVLSFTYVHLIYADVAIISFQQVEYQAEEGSFSCTIIAHQTNHLASIHHITVDIHGDLLAKTLY